MGDLGSESDLQGDPAARGALDEGSEVALRRCVIPELVRQGAQHELSVALPAGRLLEPLAHRAETRDGLTRCTPRQSELRPVERLVGRAPARRTG